MGRVSCDTPVCLSVCLSVYKIFQNFFDQQLGHETISSDPVVLRKKWPPGDSGIEGVWNFAPMIRDYNFQSNNM